MEIFSWQNTKTEYTEEEKNRIRLNRERAAGLKKVFTGRCGYLICTVAILLVTICRPAAEDIHFVAYLLVALSVISIVGMIVLCIMELIGLYEVGVSLQKCKRALVFTVLQIALGFLTDLPISLPWVFFLLTDRARLILVALIVWLVCTSVSGVLEEAGVSDIAASGRRIWKLRLLITLLWLDSEWLLPMLAIGLESLLLARIVSIVAYIFYLAVEIKYIKFLYDSSYLLSA